MRTPDVVFLDRRRALLAELDEAALGAAATLAALSVAPMIPFVEEVLRVEGGPRHLLFVVRFLGSGHRESELAEEIETFIGSLANAPERLPAPSSRVSAFCRAVGIPAALSAMNALRCHAATDRNVRRSAAEAAFDQADSVTCALADDAAALADRALAEDAEDHRDGARELQLRYLARLRATPESATQLVHAALEWAAQVHSLATACLDATRAESMH